MSQKGSFPTAWAVIYFDYGLWKLPPFFLAANLTMHIEINGDAEKLIAAGLLAGEFCTAEEAISAMAKAWADKKEEQLVLPRHLPGSTDIVALAAEKGVRPFDPRNAPPDFWPEEELVDDFLAFLREVRRDGPTVEDPQG
jgi:hypothetical protein